MAGRCNLKQGNALKHGVYSTLGLLPGESPAKFKKHQKDVIDEFRPNGPVEHDIIVRPHKDRYDEDGIVFSNVSSSCGRLCDRMIIY